MSALPPKADMCSALAYVCFVPKADIGVLSGSAGPLPSSQPEKKGPLRVTPHSDPPTIGRIRGPTLVVRRLAHIDWLTKQVRLCNRSQVLLNAPFCDG
jgi:hypothetical protein